MKIRIFRPFRERTSGMMNLDIIGLIFYYPLFCFYTCKRTNETQIDCSNNCIKTHNTASIKYLLTVNSSVIIM